MVYCKQCMDNIEPELDEAGGFAACPMCGLILEDIAFSGDVQFAKGADGEGELVGQFVSETGHVRGIGRMAGGRLWGTRGDSHETAVNKGRYEIQMMVDHFTMRPKEDCLEASHRLYRLALQQGFTKGRRVNQVAAACLYIICRQEGKPFMLIDFSDYLQVNVFTLGAVYIQLLRLLRLEDHPTYAKPMDPSLFIQRFCEQLRLGQHQDDKPMPHEAPHLRRAPTTGRESDDFSTLRAAVANTALRLISSMQRDWMQTGRRPSGVCGAALFLACHIHGTPRPKHDIMRVVHVGWSTLDSRVREFRATAVSCLTAAELEEAAREADTDERRLLQQIANDPDATNDDRDHTCVHVQGGRKHFAHGMCQECFLHFLKASGGIWASSADPPAFTRAEAQRQAEADEAANGIGAGAPRLSLPAPVSLGTVAACSTATSGPVLLEGFVAAEEARQASTAAGVTLEQHVEDQQEDDEKQQQHEHSGRTLRTQRHVMRVARVAWHHGGHGMCGRSSEGGRVGTEAVTVARGHDRGRGRGSSHAQELELQVEEEVGQLDSSLHDMHVFFMHGGDAGGHNGRHGTAARESLLPWAHGPPPLQQPPQQLRHKTQRLHKECPVDKWPTFGASLLGYGAAAAVTGAKPSNALSYMAAPLQQGEAPKEGASQLQSGTQDTICLPRASDDLQCTGAGGSFDDGLQWRSQQQQQHRPQQPKGPFGLTPQAPALMVESHNPQHGSKRRREKRCRNIGEEAGASRQQLIEHNDNSKDEKGSTDDEGQIETPDEDAHETLSGMDDAEIDGYLATADERRRREALWNQLNKDWLEEQAAKAATVAEGGKRIHAEEEGREGGDEDAAMANSRSQQVRKHGQKRVVNKFKAEEAPEADNAAAAAAAMLRTKKLSDKINYKMLDNLFDSAVSAAAAGTSTTAMHFSAAEAIAHHKEARSVVALQRDQLMHAERTAMEQQRRGGDLLLIDMFGVRGQTAGPGNKRLGSLPGKRLQGLATRRK